jgi:hypothetical protein
MEFVDATMLQIEDSPSADAFLECVTEDEEAAFSPAPLYRKSARYRKEHIDYARLRRIKPVPSIDDELRSQLIAHRDGADAASLGTWSNTSFRVAAMASPAAASPAALPGSPPPLGQGASRGRSLRLSREPQRQQGKGNIPPLSSSRSATKGSRSGGSFRKR